MYLVVDISATFLQMGKDALSKQNRNSINFWFFKSLHCLGKKSEQTNKQEKTNPFDREFILASGLF